MILKLALFPLQHRVVSEVPDLSRVADKRRALHQLPPASLRGRGAVLLIRGGDYGPGIRGDPYRGPRHFPSGQPPGGAP